MRTLLLASAAISLALSPPTLRSQDAQRLPPPAKPESAASSNETPIGPKWWPSEWGPNDQRGAANRLTPAKVIEAKELIRAGKTYQLGRLYEFGMPLPGKRHFSLTIPGMPTVVAECKNRVVYNDEVLSAETGRVGT
ncbi:MAG: hypothetical protein FJ403_08050 [Verrucomicrobia bacterium]|nr:hypothetical protein [Verrucomicrobiota bacterium]